jgi:hypothetical protein
MRALQGEEYAAHRYKEGGDARQLDVRSTEHGHFHQ